MKLTASIILAAVATTASAVTHTWKGSSTSTSWGAAANWTSGVAPTAVEANVKLVFPSSAFTTTVNNIPGLKVDDITITGGNYSFAASGGGTLTFTGVSAIGLNNAPPAGQTNTFENTLPIGFQGAIWRVENGFGPLELKSNISGTGTLKRTGVGTVTFSGSGANPFSGGLRCEGGNTVMAKAFGVRCFSGNGVNVGDPAGLVKAELILAQTDQLLNTVSLSVSAKGVVTLKALMSQTILGLNLQGGSVNLEQGNIVTEDALLTLNGNIFVASANQYSSIYGGGKLNLSSSGQLPTIITTDENPAGQPQYGLAINTPIVNNSNNNGFTKQGLGKLQMSTSFSTFGGPVLVSAGTLEVNSSADLGSNGASYGTTVAAGATLHVRNGVSMDEPLTLDGGLLYGEGNVTWTGTIKVMSPSQIASTPGATFFINGQLSGTAAWTTSALHYGELEFAGALANAYTGAFNLNYGTLRLNRSHSFTLNGQLDITTTDPLRPARAWCLRANQLGANCDVTLGSALNSEWDLGGYDADVASVAGGGKVKLGSGSLTVGGTNHSSEFHGVITGDAAGYLTKKGTGIFTINPATVGGLPVSSSYPGFTYIYGGTLLINDQQPAPFVLLSGGTLGGTGSVGAVTIDTGGTLCLCHLKTLSVTSLAPGGIIRAALTGSGNYEHTVTTGLVTLTGTTFSPSLIFQPILASKFTLIENDGTDPVVGTFTGLAEGAALLINGKPFTISYHGGDGNDVALTYTGSGPQAPVITAITYSAAQNKVFLTGKGSPGVNYKWQGSSDLQTWVNFDFNPAVPNAQGIISTSFLTNDGFPPSYYFRLTLPDTFLP